MEDYKIGLGLTRPERTGETWLKIVSFLESKLSKLHAENESFSLTADQTRDIRAQIAVCKQILAAGNPPGQDDVAVEVIGSDGVPVALPSDNDWSA